MVSLLPFPDTHTYTSVTSHINQEFASCRLFWLMKYADREHKEKGEQKTYSPFNPLLTVSVGSLYLVKS
jgi:hypothetical protein